VTALNIHAKLEVDRNDIQSILHASANSVGVNFNS
jgi:hypothetical protein